MIEQSVDYVGMASFLHRFFHKADIPTALQFDSIEGRLDGAVLKSQRCTSYEEMRDWLIGEVELNQQAKGLVCVTGTLLLRQGYLLNQLTQPNRLTIHYCFGSGYDVQLLWLPPVLERMA